MNEFPSLINIPDMTINNWNADIKESIFKFNSQKCEVHLMAMLCVQLNTDPKKFSNSLAY